MKLSEAILLGSTVVKPLGGGLGTDPSRQTCAFMMAAAAQSKPACMWAEAAAAWPWLTRQLAHVPCGCRGWDRYLPANYMTAIIHIFACHVAQGESCYAEAFEDKWTIERLADWIAAVEPSDDLNLASAGREEHALAAVDEG